MSQCLALTKDNERCKNSAEHLSLFCRRHRWWWFFTLVALTITITTIGANIATMFGVTFPNPLGATTTPTPTETPTSTYIPAIPTEPPTLTLTYTTTPTTTWTLSPIPSQTSTRSKNSTSLQTVTPLAPENYGGLTENCIPDRYWDFTSPVDIELRNGCLQLDARGFYADYRILKIILPSEDVRNNQVEDLLLPISGDQDISFSVVVKEFKGSGRSHLAPLFSIGICNLQEPITESNSILYSYRDDGSILWGIINNGYDNFEKSYPYALNTPQDFIIQIRSYDLTIKLGKGNTTIDVWDKTIPPKGLSAFCVHYTLPTLGKLTATIADFLVEPK